MFVRLQALKNLVPAILLNADLDRSLGETATVDRDPNRHCSVSLSDDSLGGDGEPKHPLTDMNDETGKHSRSQQMLGVVDFGAYQLPMGVRVYHRADRRDPPLE